MVFVVQQSTIYWDVYVDPTFYTAGQLTTLGTLMPYIDAFTAKLRKDFGYDIFPLPGGQARLALVLDPASHGGATGTSFGLIGITIAGDSVYGVAFGVASFWFYILSLHETVNVWTGQLASSWVWADGSTMWGGTSPFPNACDVIITAELGLSAVSAAQAARFTSDKGVQLFLKLQSDWGWYAFESAFAFTAHYGITDWSAYSEPLRTAILAWFLSWSARAAKPSVLAQFNTATASLSGQTVPDGIFQQAQRMFQMSFVAYCVFCGSAWPPASGGVYTCQNPTCGAQFTLAVATQPLRPQPD